jgi:hypothetical protein
MRLEVAQPVLTNEDLERIRNIEDNCQTISFRPRRCDMTYPARGREGHGCRAGQALCRRPRQAVREGYNILILSDRHGRCDRIPIPALLATSLAVHHHLIRCGLRTVGSRGRDRRAALEVHHFARWPAMAPKPSTRTWHSTRIEAHAAELDEEIEPRRGAQALHQGRQQGPAQGHVEDGHLDLPVLLRRADLRRGRAQVVRRQVLHRHQHAGRGYRVWPRSRPRPCAARRRPSATRSPTATPRRRRRLRVPAARRSHSGRPQTSWPSCSTRCAATTPETYREYPKPSTSRTSSC